MRAECPGGAGGFPREEVPPEGEGGLGRVHRSEDSAAIPTLTLPVCIYSRNNSCLMAPSS